MNAIEGNGKAKYVCGKCQVNLRGEVSYMFRLDKSFNTGTLRDIGWHAIRLCEACVQPINDAFKELVPDAQG